MGNLSFSMEPQDQDQWCWAAVSASISGYYSPEDKWSQCKIASYVLEGNCCEEPASHNKAAYLQEALKVIEKLRGIELRCLDNPAQVYYHLSQQLNSAALIQRGGGTGPMKPRQPQVSNER